eukprot:scaffold16571_cov76-Attheya_sp.AAC.5
MEQMPHNLCISAASRLSPHLECSLDQQCQEKIVARKHCHHRLTAHVSYLMTQPRGVTEVPMDIYHDNCQEVLPSRYGATSAATCGHLNHDGAINDGKELHKHQI